MKPSFIFTVIVLSMLLLVERQAQTKTVSESERQIPLSYDVDVIVVGGTLRGVAAAEAAAKQGAKVFLVTDRPYLGEDICATQKKLRDMKKEAVLMKESIF